MADVFIQGLRVKPSGEQAIANYVWDTNTLDWVPQSANNAGGGVAADVTVTNAISLSSTTLQALSDMAMRNAPLRTDVVTPELIYQGYAAAGADPAAAVWSIKKVTPTQVFWALGSNAWNSRASLTYI